MKKLPPPVALSIAGSDNSAGAGIQADLKTFSAHGVYGLTAVTCVVAEVPGKVSRIVPVPVEVVHEQIRLSLAAFPVAAVKTGMLFSREIVELVAAVFAALPPGRRPPLVIDPVMVATGGDPLLRADAVAAYTERLFPLAALVTPNLDETRVLLGAGHPPITDADVLRAAGRELAARFNVPFLAKGGHLGADAADGSTPDFLCLPDGRAMSCRAPFTPGVQTHGTGCTYSAAVAANLAAGCSLGESVAHAKAYVSAAVAGFYRWPAQDGGRGLDALAHFPAEGDVPAVDIAGDDIR